MPDPTRPDRQAGPMTPEDIPTELMEILDRAAYRKHPPTGSVATCLAEILTRHEAMVRAQVVKEIMAPMALTDDESYLLPGFGEDQYHERCGNVYQRHFARVVRGG